MKELFSYFLLVFKSEYSTLTCYLYAEAIIPE